MKRLMTATVAAASLATPLAASETPIESVDVTFEIQDIESAPAAEFWSNLEGDLEGKIIALVSDRISEDGSEISIDVDEFDLSNSFQGTLGVDSVLTGAIEVRNEDDPTKNSFYDLRVTVDEAAKFVYNDGDAQVVAHEREDIYDAMIETFADGVVKRLR